MDVGSIPRLSGASIQPTFFVLLLQHVKRIVLQLYNIIWYYIYVEYYVLYIYILSIYSGRHVRVQWPCIQHVCRVLNGDLELLRYHSLRLRFGVRGRLAAICCTRLWQTKQVRTYPERCAQQLGCCWAVLCKISEMTDDRQCGSMMIHVDHCSMV